MSIAAGLRELIWTDGLVGELVDDRVYQEQADEGTAEPYVLIVFRERNAERDLQGIVLANRYLYHVMACGSIYEDVEEIRDAIYESLGGDVAYETELLDGEQVVIRINETPEVRQNVPAQDEIKHQMTIEVNILEINP